MQDLNRHLRKNSVHAWVCGLFQAKYSIHSDASHEHNTLKQAKNSVSCSMPMYNTDTL